MNKPTNATLRELESVVPTDSELHAQAIFGDHFKTEFSSYADCAYSHVASPFARVDFA